MDKIKQVFNGDERLVITFWVWGFAGSIVYNLIVVWGIFVWLLGVSQPLVITLVGLVYSIFAWISIWRSSDKYDGQKVWAIVAKVLIVLGVLMTLYNLFNPHPMPWS